MENETRKLQLVILDMAKEILSLCEEYHIPYSLNGGTLLGAVRHKGFIPWDDDLDLCMCRKDYERFLVLCKKKLDPNKYYIQTPDVEKQYGFAFAKIRLLGTEIIEDFSKNVPVQNGIFIDIFPYDNLPEGKLARKLFLIVNHYYKNLDWVKCGYGEDAQKQKMSYKVIRFLSNFYSMKQIKASRKRLIQKYNGSDTKMMFISDYPTEIIPHAWMENLKKYQFEDAQFFGMADSKKYLKHTYGADYMELPPPEKRIQHSACKINFGKYK